MQYVRSSDRKLKLVRLKKERYAPHPCKDNFARFSVADPLLLARRWPDPHPAGAFESCRSLGRDPRTHTRSFSPLLGAPRPARLKGQEDTPWSPAQEMVAVEKG